MPPRRPPQPHPRSPGTSEPDAGPTGQRAPLDETLVEAVLAMTERVPAGTVVSYGDLAELVERGGPRQVAAVLSRWGAGVPWWRVVRADGRLADPVRDRAAALLAEEGVVLRRGRVDMAVHRWRPDLGDGAEPAPSPVDAGEDPGEDPGQGGPGGAPGGISGTRRWI
ncbi:MGMT family protein [Auraticoccus cholistanensis]